MKPVSVERAYSQQLPDLFARHPRFEEPQPVAMLCRYDKQAIRPTYELIFEDGCKRVLTGESIVFTLAD